MSSDCRLGKKERMVGIELAGAPLRRRSIRRGSCESTVMRIVGGTPAHLCFVDEDACGR